MQEIRLKMPLSLSPFTGMHNELYVQRSSRCCHSYGWFLLKSFHQSIPTVMLSVPHLNVFACQMQGCVSPQTNIFTTLPGFPHFLLFSWPICSLAYLEIHKSNISICALCLRLYGCVWRIPSMFPLLGKYSTRNHIDYINTARLTQSYLQTKV